MKRSKGNWLLPKLVLALLCSSLRAQTLHVQIVDGLNGKPIANQHLLVFGSEDEKLALVEHPRRTEFVTDAEGFVTFSQVASTVRAVVIFVDWHHPCSKTRTFNLEQVFSEGVVSENSCKRSIKRVATPGTLVFFVRDETFLEKMAH
jgi:hypothetical protein